MKQVIIVGAGRVGLANADYFRKQADPHIIWVVDTDEERVKQLWLNKTGYEHTALPGLFGGPNRIQFLTDPAFIKIEKDWPTYVIFCIPPGKDSFNLTEEKFALENIIADYWLNFKPNLIVLRGTLTPNHIAHMREKLDVCIDRLIAYPEFLVEGYESFGVVDSQKKFIASFTGNKEKEQETRDLFKVYKEPIDIECTAEEAFAAKLWINIGLAMRVTFANLVWDSLQGVGDPNKVLKMIGRDSRIGPTYLKPSAGFGGSCLPWAVNQERHRNPLFYLQVYNNNRPIRLIPGIGDKVLVFGFNFKAGVWDHRNSAPLEFIRFLADIGKTVWVSDNDPDPVVNEWWVENPIEKVAEADNIVIFYQTRWLAKLEEYVANDPYMPDRDTFNGKILFDFR